MLHLDLAHAGARVGVVREVHRLVELVDAVRAHGAQAVVGQRGRLRLRIEVVFDVALRAGGGALVHLVKVRAHRIGEIGVRHDDVAGLVGMAVVAADALVHLRQHVLKGHGVGADALVVHRGGEVRRLAGEAVGQLVRAARAGHVLDGVVVAACAVVIGVERHALVHGSDHRILLHMVDDRAVLLILQVGCVHVRIRFGPVAGRHDAHARARGHNARRLGGGGGAQQQHRQQQHNRLLHGLALLMICPCGQYSLFQYTFSGGEKLLFFQLFAVFDKKKTRAGRPAPKRPPAAQGYPRFAPRLRILAAKKPS